MMLKKGLLLFLTCVAGVDICVAAELRKSASIAYAANPITVDGVVDETEWVGATIIDDLHQFEPEDHGEPSEPSEFLVSYDEDYLYVAARLYDAAPHEILARQLIQGQTLRFDDTISIVLDPYDTRRSGYNFQVNANGIRRESVFENTTAQNRNWTAIWFTEGRITEYGWEVEVAIPFKSINFDPNKSDWGFSVRRSIAHKQEQLAWTSFARAVNPSTTGLLRGVDKARKGVGLDVVPSVTLTERSGDIGTRDSFEIQPSLDISYKFTSLLNGLLTFNTDFAATEVDDRQINLSRFSLFLQEKRSFFLQDTDIFTFGGIREDNGIPFFSRRIGLSQQGTPLDILAGAKVTGRIAGFNVGILNVLQESGVEDADDVNLVVGRLSYDIFDESTLGMIFTDGDPLSELSNSLVGVDFLFRSKTLVADTDFSVDTWFQQSSTEGLSDNEAAWGIAIDVPRQEGFGGNIDFLHIDENFKAALGFVNRPNIEQTSAEINYVKRFSSRWIRRYEPSIGYSIVRGLDGRTQSEYMKLTIVSLEADAGDEFEFGLARERDVVTEDFDIVDGVIVSAGDYTFDRVFIEYEGPGERKIALEAEVSVGDFYDGTLVTVSTDIDWRPSPHYLFSLGYEINEGDIQNGSFTTRLITARANIAFNSKWSWTNFMQYDNVSEEAGINSRLRWNPKAGQDMYLVLNQGYRRDDRDRFQSTESELTAKVGYTFRF
jgi:hypothetical protein